MFHGLDGYQPIPSGRAPFERDAIQIVHKRIFRPLQPIGPDNDIDIETVAHALSLTNRWNGFTSYSDGSPLAYTVAQHAVHVADLVQMAREKLVPDWDWDNDESPGPYGLHHDDSEAFIADIVRPVKPHLTNYAELEGVLMNGILDRFKIPMSPGIREAVRRVDNIMIFLERDALMGRPDRPYGNEMDHPRLSIFDVIPDFHIWSPRDAKQRYMAKHEELTAAGRERYEPLEYRGRGYGL